MRLAAALAAACTVAALGAVPASAAARAKASCNVIKDDTGDASLAAQVPSDDSLDIVGGDFAANSHSIVGIIRVKAFANPNPRAPLGQVYVILFTAPKTGDTLTLSATVTPAGTTYAIGHDAPDPTTGVTTSYTYAGALGSITGNVIRIRAESSGFPQMKALVNGARVTGIAAEARMIVGQRAVPSQDVGPARVPFGGLTEQLDDAAGTPYVIGTRSCVSLA